MELSRVPGYYREVKNVSGLRQKTLTFASAYREKIDQRPKHIQFKDILLMRNADPVHLGALIRARNSELDLQDGGSEHLWPEQMQVNE
jgi:hypothetical protein